MHPIFSCITPSWLCMCGNLLELDSLRNKVRCVGSWGRNLTARKPPWEQTGQPPMVNIMHLANCESARRTSYQPVFMGSCLTINHMCIPCLPRWVSPCVLCYGFSSMGSWCYFRKWAWNLRTKLLHASGEWNVSRVSLQEFDIRYMF